MGRLERDSCNALRDYLHGDKQSPTFDQMVAVNVLSHEAHHLAGESDEALTECASMQQIAEVATWLGATAEQGRSLAERYAGEVYPRMPSNYRSQDCVVDGSLDETPGDGEWP